MQPGTGKTRVAVDLIRSARPDRVIWMAPLSSINHPSKGIKDEVKKWGGCEAPIIFAGLESLSSSDRLYLRLHTMIEAATSIFLVCDESLKIKNAAAIRTKRMLELARLSDYRLILNGTPFSRGLCDLWAQMQFLSPRILAMTEKRFIRTFCETIKITDCDGTRVRQREFIVGYHNIEYLYSLIAPYVFEADLETNIKSNHFEINYDVSAEERSEYEHIKKEYLNRYKDALNHSFFLAMTQKMQMTYCTANDKFTVAKKLLTTAIDPADTLIFCKFVRSREAVADAFPRATVLSLQKDAMSLNLQRYCNIIFWDRTWDWAAIDQARHRILRMGQAADCKFYHLHATIKLDNLIRDNNDRKRTLIDYFNSASREDIINNV